MIFGIIQMNFLCGLAFLLDLSLSGKFIIDIGEKNLKPFPEKTKNSDWENLELIFEQLNSINKRMKIKYNLYT